MTRKRINILFILIALVVNAPIGRIIADDGIDENELFSSPEMMLETSAVNNNIAENDKEKKSMGVSGQIISAASFTGSRDWINYGRDSSNGFVSYILGDIFLDARLKRGVKGFLSAETLHNASLNQTDFALKELFLDFNIRDKIYFRTGKQVLQWGRCYLWNPSDLINVEKKTFVQKIGSREGTYGLKIHVPFGTALNLYGFADTGNVLNVDGLGAAGKVEFLLSKTEMAFAAWAKKGYEPVYSYDLSSRLFGIDISGEAAFSYGDNDRRLKLINGTLTKERIRNEWIPRMSMGFGRAFDFMEINDRISAVAEFYYNRAGYDENIFADKKSYLFDTPVFGGPVPKTNGLKSEYLYLNNLYSVNGMSKYYAALFISMNRFIITDMTLTVNAINNLADGSFILTTGVSYTDLNDLTLGLNIYSYLGNENGEYTAAGNALTFQLTAGIVF